MSYIIGSKCVSVCDTACVNVCPVDCIYGPIDPMDTGSEVEELKKKDKIEGLQLYINPDECIDCGACEPECPVDAIYDEEEVPEDYESSISTNYEFFGQEAP